MNSILGKLNLRCQVKVLQRLLDVSVKFRGGKETSRINVVYSEHLQEAPRHPKSF